MHLVVVRERERLADEAREPLPERVVEPLDVAGLALAFAGGPVCPLEITAR